MFRVLIVCLKLLSVHYLSLEVNILYFLLQDCAVQVIGIGATVERDKLLSGWLVAITMIYIEQSRCHAGGVGSWLPGLQFDLDDYSVPEYAMYFLGGVVGAPRGGVGAHEWYKTALSHNWWGREGRDSQHRHQHHLVPHLLLSASFVQSISLLRWKTS